MKHDWLVAKKEVDRPQFWFVWGRKGAVLWCLFTWRTMLRKVRYFNTPPILSLFGASSSGTCSLKFFNTICCQQPSPPVQHSSANGRHKQSWQLQQPVWEGPPTSSSVAPPLLPTSSPSLPPSSPASSPASFPWQASFKGAKATQKS